ncbi:two-component regulator propeller domain-containing protein [Gracilimonas sp.]|uniref:sensor histidine kinase n=1 Tax=Gracilimonas sp. TaxID=1974203 RepID=UPI0032ED0A3B
MLYLYFLLAIPFFSEAQTVNFENYVVTQFGLEEGLPQSSVNDIIQTKDGYLWLATFGGIVRFDGNSFTIFNKSNTRQLYSERILELYEDQRGYIWLFPEGDEGIIQRFKEGEAETFRFPGTGETRVEINEDKRGVLWVSAREKIFRLVGDSFIESKEINNTNLADKALKDTSGVWFAYDFKLLKTLGDSVVKIQESSGVHNERYIEVQEFPENSGNLFIGTVKAGLIHLTNGKRKVLNAANGLIDDQFIRFKKFDDERLIINLPGNISVWNGKDFDVLNPIPDQPDIRYRSILEDNEGNYWFGTDGDGLFKLSPTPITMIDGEQGLKNDKMLSITKLKDGRALFSTNCGGIFEWDGTSARRSTVHNFMDSDCNWSVFQDSRGRIWIGSLGVVYGSALNEPMYTFENELALGGVVPVFGIAEHSNGTIWILTEDGLYEYDGSHFNHYTTEEGLYANDTRALVEDREGTFWVGTRAGLNRIKAGKIEKVELNAKETDSKQPPVRAIYEDGDGYIWIGTYGNGLFRLDGSEVLNITKEDGLFDDIISHIVEDEGGYFWMGSNRGISNVKRSDLNDFLDGEIDHIQSNSYGAADGMNSAETNGGFQPSSFTDSLGRIYFPTVAGVAVVNPGLVRKNEVSPRIYIEKLNTDEGPVELSSGISLSYNTPYLEILYTAISFSEPEKVEFRYKMEGLNDDWIEVGNRREALYSKIPPGDYTFRVIAGNSDGVWNMEGASLNIVVTPPFWQTTWFYTLMGLLVAGAGGLVYYLRIEQLKRQNARQKRFTEQLIESEEQERKRIASELHDSLGQQILVIKNRAELARKFVEQPAELDEQLNEIMQSALISIADVRSISHGLRPVHLEKFGLTEALHNLCSQVQDSSSIEWSYHVDDIDEVIPKEKEINFYRVIQEGVNNIFKHAQATEASVIIRRADPGLKAMIWDNGIGFDPHDKLNAGGLGLSGMNERVETLGGTLMVNSGEMEGTTITIVISVKEWVVS